MTAKFAILPSAALFDDRIIPQQLRVLGILAYYGGNKEDGCWPSYKKLADQVGISRRLLITYIGHLVECGYVERGTRYRKDGSQTSNRFRVITDLDLDILDGDAPHHHGAANAGGVGDAQLGASKENHEIEPDNKINKKPKAAKVTIEQWETKEGANLNWQMLAGWIAEKKLCKVLVQEQIEIFRTKMVAGDNRYADFKAAFQNYVNSGYMPKAINQLLAETSPHQVRGYHEKVQRGVSI